MIEEYCLNQYNIGNKRVCDGGRRGKYREVLLELVKRITKHDPEIINSIRYDITGVQPRKQIKKH